MIGVDVLKQVWHSDTLTALRLGVRPQEWRDLKTTEFHAYGLDKRRISFWEIRKVVKISVKVMNESRKSLQQSSQQ